jgi:hypothetical protein
MATRDSTSDGDEGRGAPQVEPGEAVERTGEDAANAGQRTLEAGINAERMCLMKAEAVLNCVSFALSSASWHADDGTMYALAVDVARETLQGSITRLEVVGSSSRHIDRP